MNATAATADEQPLVRYDVQGLGEETCLVSAELYRWQDDWEFRAVGQGYAAGLAGLRDQHRDRPT